MLGHHVDIDRINDLLREVTLPECQGRGRRAVDFAALRQHVSLAEVLSLLEFEPLSRRSHQVRGMCPLHGSPSERNHPFSGNQRRNDYQCYAHRCGSRGNQLDFWIAVTGLPSYEVAEAVGARLSKDVPHLALSDMQTTIRCHNGKQST
jgi:hypothetical protein